MPAVSFRKKDFASGGFALKGVYTVRESRLIENDYKGAVEHPDIMLQWEVEGEDGTVRNTQWRVGPTKSKAGETIYEILNDGKSVDGPAPYADSEIALIMGSLDDAGFPMDSLESNAVDGDGNPYQDVTKFAGYTFRFAEDRRPNKYKDKKTGQMVEKERVTSIVTEILGSPDKGKKTVAKSTNGTAKAAAKAAEPAEDDIDSLARTVVCRIAAAYKDAEGEPAPAPVTRLSGKISTVLGSKSAHFDDILALVADPEWIAENAEGHWTIKGGKLSLTKVGTDLVEAL